MKIGVCGIGMVGGAVFKFFDDLVHTVGYDPHKVGFQDHNVLRGCDVIFVCVPTPTDHDGQDLSAVLRCLNMIRNTNPHAEIVLKSTVLPGTCRDLWARLGVDIIHNPEFLTERNALADFANQEEIVIGSDVVTDLKVVELYKTHFPSSPILETSTSTAELIKYAHNCFLAAKVSFWNEMFLAAKKCKANFEEVTEHLVATGKMGNTHNKVPGPDGQLGFGGACFPKDTAAFARWYGNGLISSVVDVNKIHRGN